MSLAFAPRTGDNIAILHADDSEVYPSLPADWFLRAPRYVQEQLAHQYPVMEGGPRVDFGVVYLTGHPECDAALVNDMRLRMAFGTLCKVGRGQYGRFRNDRAEISNIDESFDGFWVAYETRKPR